MEPLEQRILMAGDLSISPIARQFVADTAAVEIHATFTDLHPGTGYQATINWGDNQQSTATVDASTFTITASHSYAADGNYTPTVSLTRGAEAAQRQFVASVFNPAIGMPQQLPIDPNNPDIRQYLVTMPDSWGVNRNYRVTFSGDGGRAITEVDASGGEILGTTRTFDTNGRELNGPSRLLGTGMPFAFGRSIGAMAS